MHCHLQLFAGFFVVLRVEQDALMCPNPRGKLEDLVAGCVCVLSSCLKLVNSLLKLIQVHLNL